MSFEFSQTGCSLEWTSIGGACLGHGNCSFSSEFARDVCFCDNAAGWYGDTDFRIGSEQTSCTINIVGIRVLWAILLVLMTASAAMTAPRTYMLWEKHQTIAAKHRANGKKYTLLQNRAFFVHLQGSVVLVPCFLALCILKLVNPRTHIGGDWAPTILYLLVRTSIYMGTFVLQPALLASLLRSQRTFDHIIRRNNVVSVIFLFFCTASGLLSIWPVVADPYDNFNPVPGVASFLFLAVTLTLSTAMAAVQSYLIEQEIVRTLDKSHQVAKDARTLEIKDKLSSLQRAMRSSLLVQAVLYTVLVVIPILWTMHDYFLPISWLVIPSVHYRVPASIVETQSRRRKRGSSAAADGVGGTGGTGGAGGGASIPDRRTSGPNDSGTAGTGTGTGGGGIGTQHSDGRNSTPVEAPLKPVTPTPSPRHGDKGLDRPHSMMLKGLLGSKSGKGRFNADEYDPDYEDTKASSAGG